MTNKVKEVKNLMDKIEIAKNLMDTVKDYIEILKINPKLKQTFNKSVIDEQIKVNESDIKKSVEALLEIKL